MPINRGPFNALIDDDGSGKTGSIWNKAAISGVLLDPIDALVGPVTPYTPTWRTGTGAIAINNGALAGLYVNVNGLVVFTINMVWGSGTAGPTDAWLFGLPPPVPRTGFDIWGVGHALGPPYVPLYCLQFGATEVQPVYGPGGTTETALSYTVPFTWAAGKRMVLSGAYFV